LSRFCYWHIYTKENPRGTDCSAHMIEARVFECPYKTAEESQREPYPCADYRVGEMARKQCERPEKPTINIQDRIAVMLQQEFGACPEVDILAEKVARLIAEYHKEVK
jgi:hypothetical protein